MSTRIVVKLAWLTGITLGAMTAVAADPAVVVKTADGEAPSSVRSGPGGGAGGPQTELEWQYAALLNDLRERNRIAALASQTFRPEALILPSDRDPADVVARRTAALLADLKRSLAAGKVNARQEQLQALQIELAGVPTESAERRYELYERLCGLRRQIAFANPLLDFRELVFIKRHRSLFNHMCDQYYGITAQPGGGLYILSDPTGSQPTVRDVLADSRLANGRLEGKKLTGGANKRYQLYYVDRHGCTAHMPWITTLDGRDPRPVHGNYAPRQTRPDMELNVRAIPGSQKLIATAAPHHGQAFGSLVMIDPDVPDDDAMAPVKRLTPEVGFPESQDGAEAFGTAWPLSENYYLCAYDLRMPSGNHVGQHLKQYANNYGLYLVDSFGNKELLYRDPEISCLSPIPLRPRLKPPLAALATAAARINPATPTAEPACPAEATVSVVNVYESLLPWPEGTRIKALRVLPMTVPSGAPPHETGLRVASAGDSVVPVRHVLGTVPVEEDGSAHLVVPANRELFFQALDERGLAVQSMRSATALRAGEHLTCQGCHAPAQRAPRLPATMPLAMRRPPSRLQPDVDGSNPFSYPRLVQPVLDRNCVACHADNHGQAPNLAREPLQRKWYASYASLTPRFGFFDYGDSYRTTPGRFGARASKLLELLDQGHHGVKLTEDDFHRLTLWLDCSSMFYGVYEKEGGEAQLRGEIARPTLE
jgi:hypothetical protein